MSEQPSFEVLEIRASGAYATVCRVRRVGDPLKREIAVKALRATLVDNARALMRTRDEARMLARMSHPNIVRVEELLSIDRRPVLVMEWVDGASLRELLDRNRGGIPVGAALEAIAQSCRALEDAWNVIDESGQPMRIVHRDIKPGNVLLSTHGNVKVVDFGLSRGEYFERETTTVSTVLGSMGYMAPERFRTGIGDHPSIDVYALGLTLTELMTGRLPLLPRDPPLHDKAVENFSREIRTVALLPDQLKELRRLVVNMCRFEPEDRPSYQEVRDHIATLQREGGLETDLVGFARDFVSPIRDERPAIDPKDHPKWEEVAFLEDPGDGAIPQVRRDREDRALADKRVRLFLSAPNWADRKRELKWLLALHPDWTAEPFMEVLQRTTRPWWLFWVQSVSTAEVAVALEILRHRPVPEVRPFAEQLIKDADVRVAGAAEVVLDRLTSEGV